MQELQAILQGTAIDCSEVLENQIKNIELIHQEIKSQLQTQFNYQKNYLLGKDASSEMQNILSSISPEVLVKKLFLEKLKQNQSKLLSEIDLQISYFKKLTRGVKRSTRSTPSQNL